MSEALRCPSCGRPVAVVRPQCLYCGQPLPAEMVDAAQAAREEAAPSVSAAAVPGLRLPLAVEGPAGAERTYLILDLRAASTEAVAAALGGSAFEAGQRLRRGGFQLHRVLPVAEAEAESARLGGHGLAVLAVPEAEVKEGAQALVATSGTWDGTALRVRAEEADLVLEPAEVLLVVKGPIAREYQTSANVKRVRLAGLDPGYRFHLHRRDQGRPLELDPSSFGFREAPAAGSSLLEITAWVEEIGRGRAQDDGFRREPPVLAPGAADHDLAGAFKGPRTRASDAPLILDNVGQFRLYSSWRAAVARRSS